MMTAATSSQLNVRIDANLKERGSRGLTRAGYTPARAIRRLWTIAAENENEPEVIERLLSGTNATASSAENSNRSKRIEALHQGWKIIRDGADGAGLHAPTAKSALPYAELRESAAAERLAEYDSFDERA